MATWVTSMVTSKWTWGLAIEMTALMVSTDREHQGGDGLRTKAQPYSSAWTFLCV